MKKLIRELKLWKFIYQKEDKSEFFFSVFFPPFWFVFPFIYKEFTDQFRVCGKREEPFKDMVCGKRNPHQSTDKTKDVTCINCYAILNE